MYNVHHHCVTPTWPLPVAQDDLERVTEMAYKQVVQFGMSPAIGHVSFPLKRREEFGKRPYSKQLSKMIDEVSRCYHGYCLDRLSSITLSYCRRCVPLWARLIWGRRVCWQNIHWNWRRWDNFLVNFLSWSHSIFPPQLAEVLLEKEVLNYRDMVDLLGPMPFEKKFHHYQELADLWWNYYSCIQINVSCCHV